MISVDLDWLESDETRDLSSRDKDSLVPLDLHSLD